MILLLEHKSQANWRLRSARHSLYVLFPSFLSDVPFAAMLLAIASSK
jgi:hypothetical protein